MSTCLAIGRSKRRNLWQRGGQAKKTESSRDDGVSEQSRHIAHAQLYLSYPAPLDSCRSDEDVLADPDASYDCADAELFACATSRQVSPSARQSMLSQFRPFCHARPTHLPYPSFSSRLSPHIDVEHIRTPRECPSILIFHCTVSSHTFLCASISAPHTHDVLYPTPKPHSRHNFDRLQVFFTGASPGRENASSLLALTSFPYIPFRKHTTHGSPSLIVFLPHLEQLNVAQDFRLPTSSLWPTLGSRHPRHYARLNTNTHEALAQVVQTTLSRT